MPINRDGKHWCDPASEEPNEDGEWPCPDCGTTWLFAELPGGSSVWETPEGREIRLEAEKQMAEAMKAAEQDAD